LLERFFEDADTGTNVQLSDLAGMDANGIKAALQALDPLDSVTVPPGAVSVTEDPMTGFMRFVVDLTRTLSGTADVDLSAFGGSLTLAGSVTVSADVELHLVFGVDANGFYIDPLASELMGGPELLIHHITIDASTLDASGDFGLVNVDISSPA